MRSQIFFAPSRLIAIGLATLLLTLGNARAADDLEKKLISVAPEILEHARNSGYRNIGVLKFRVGNERNGTTDSALGRRLADKLEMALILKNELSNEIGIAKQASEHAAIINGASHLSVAGRQKLFTKPYPMSWGDQEKELDAFYTGTAVIHRNLSKITMMIQVVDPKISTLTPVKILEIQPDIDDLLDAGESFRVRGLFDDAKLNLSESERKDQATEEAVLTSLKIDAEATKEDESEAKSADKEPHPLAPDHPDVPIRFEVRYDGKPQTITFQGDQAFVAEPETGQSVEFVVTRAGSERPRLAVVVKVNGENTLRKQTLPDAKCGAWVFEPTMDIFGIKGFQMEDNQREPFQVLSQTESAAKEIDYGQHAGTISITVFPERKSDGTASSKANVDTTSETTLSSLFDGEDFALLNEAMHPEKSPSTLGALKSQLDTRGHLVTRGLIVGKSSKRIEANVTKTNFERDTIPMMSATLRYRPPGDLP
ncbi:hypothetical protein [Neorhodopirellula pilleata]|uniref:Bacterial type II and III secretion system protein n=1 Tax=Neorhodopirellula pilleata TaxID=2714738 RepID=A0A5C6A3Z6_9BACT|nr:hypothetical protein [Neorhodopirellula pilleata]TWT94219.1 hypothetical protein Pla100_38290 [Neorhodopirellula pilleata]